MREGGIQCEFKALVWSMEVGWRIWSRRSVFKAILMGLRLGAKRRHTFSGAENVERTEILHFSLLFKNRLIPFMKSWSVASLPSVVTG